MLKKIVEDAPRSIYGEKYVRIRFGKNIPLWKMDGDKIGEQNLF